jgi:hypothetical protein
VTTEHADATHHHAPEPSYWPIVLAVLLTAAVVGLMINLMVSAIAGL